MKRSASPLSAFTLLEIMLVVMIIALLAGAAIYQMGGQVNTARVARAQSDIQALKTSVVTYEGSNGHFPSTEQGLKALVSKPTSEPRPRNWTPIMKEIPLDPWQQEYRYERPGTRSKDGFDLYSAGPDNQPNTADDVGNWKAES